MARQLIAVATRVPPATRQPIEQEATRQDRRISYVVRRALEEAFSTRAHATISGVSARSHRDEDGTNGA